MSSLLETKEAGNAANQGAETAQESAASAAAATAATEEKKPIVATTAQAAEVKPELPKREGAPEKYDFKAPEGTTFDAAFMTRFEGVLRAADIPQKHADALLGLGAELQASVAQALDEANKARTKAWREEAEKIPEFSVEKRKDTSAQIRAFLSDEKVLGEKAEATLAAINDSGLGVHPGLLKALSVAAKLHAEDLAILSGHGGAPDVVTWKDVYDKSDHV